MPPLETYCLPIGSKHPGSFGAVRKHDRHTGLDLYCEKGSEVTAVESGKVIRIGLFTGPGAGSAWWNDTWAVAVRSKDRTNVTIIYGELEHPKDLILGQKIKYGQKIGHVAQVLKSPPKVSIPGHSMSMLHLELWFQEFETWPVWPLGDKCPTGLYDPMFLLRR